MWDVEGREVSQLPEDCSDAAPVEGTCRQRSTDLVKNTMDLYLLILISAAAMLTCRPRRDEVINLISA